VLYVYKFKARFVIDIVYSIYQTNPRAKKKNEGKIEGVGKNWPEEKDFSKGPEGGKKQKRRETREREEPRGAKKKTNPRADILLLLATLHSAERPNGRDSLCAKVKRREYKRAKERRKTRDASAISMSAKKANGAV
jgi:hypothetical protein